MYLECYDDPSQFCTILRIYGRVKVNNLNTISLDFE